MKEQDPVLWATVKAEADARWEAAYEMFSKVDELHSDILEHLRIVPDGGDDEVDGYGSEDMVISDEEVFMDAR